MCNSYKKRDITHFANGETIFIYMYVHVCMCICVYIYIYGNSHNPSGLKRSEEDWNSGSCPHSYPYGVANSASNYPCGPQRFLINHFTIIFTFLFMTF